VGQVIDIQGESVFFKRVGILKNLCLHMSNIRGSNGSGCLI